MNLRLGGIRYEHSQETQQRVAAPLYLGGAAEPVARYQTTEEAAHALGNQNFRAQYQLTKILIIYRDIENIKCEQKYLAQHLMSRSDFGSWDSTFISS